MSVEVINGWTGPRLDTLNGHVESLRDDVAMLKPDVSEIRSTLSKMLDDDRRADKQRIKDLEGRPRAWLFGLGAPLIMVVLGEVLSHAFS